MDNEVNVPIETQTLLRILPHRYPFLLVDRVLEVEPGLRIVARKNVTANEPHFKGHFPGDPIMPGVLQLEMIAQAGCVLVLLMEKNKGRLVLLTGIEKARFRRKVVPGDTIDIEVVVERLRGNMGWVKGVAQVDGKTICEAHISFAMADLEVSEP